MKSVLLLLLLTALSAIGADFDGTSRTGTNIIQNPATFGAYYNGQDAPEGVWYNSTEGNSNATNQTMHVDMPATLAAGIWRFQLKTIDYDRYHTVRFTLADGIGSSSLSDRDSSRWLESGVIVTNTYPTNHLDIFFQTSDGTPLKVLISALYWTTNLNEAISTNGNDLVVNYTYPASTSTVVDNTNNIVPNSSFEAGLGNWRPNEQNRYWPLSLFTTTDTAQHGNWALKTVGPGDEIVSPYLYVKDDSRSYSLSLYWKGSGAVRIKTALGAPAGFTATVDTNWTLGFAAAWTRTNWIVNLKNYPFRAAYVIKLTSTVSNTLFDGIMLHEGTNLAPYRPMRGLDVGWSNSVVSGVYYTNQANTPYIVAYNSSGTTRTVDVKYEFVNQFNVVTASGTVSSSLADGGRLVQAIALPTAPGWYRGVCWSDGVEPQETVLTVIPTPIANTYIGTHGFGTVWQNKGLVRAGITESRYMSPQALFRWSVSEPTDNNFDYADFYMTNSTFNGANVLGTLGSEDSSVPTYAGSTVSAMDNAQWTNNVQNVVNHYKSWCTNWEIWNEPSQGNVTVAQYTNILKLASAAIKAVDPNAKITGIGGSATYSFITDVLNAFGTGITNIIDTASLHGYPPGSDPYSSGGALAQASGWSPLLTTYPNIPFWNTESGQWDWGGAMAYSRYNTIGGAIYSYGHNRPYFGGLIEVPWQISQHALAYKAYGFAKYFYYDSRVLTEDLWVENHPSSWEGDEGHRPKMAALAVVNYITAGTTGAGLLATRSNNVVFLYFENGNNSRAAVWTTNAAHYTITLTNVLAYDWMLGPKTVSVSNYVIGRMPTYLVPNGLTSANFKSALTNASYAPVADTFAPNVSIFLFPGSSITDTNRMLARWGVVDEQSVPGPNNQLDLLTRSALKANGSAPADVDYDAWSTSVQRVWTNVVSTNMTLYVQGKDAAGNTSTQTRMFGAEASAPSATRREAFGKVTYSGKVE